MEQSKTSAQFFPTWQRGDDMGRFYGVKIKSGEINDAIGEAWTLEDVPKLWRKATAAWLAANTD